MIDAAMVAMIARQLRTAEVEGSSSPLPNRLVPALVWDDARAIAKERDRLRLEDGDTQIGYKLGWTSEAMRVALGIDRPNWGTLWASQLVQGELSLARLRHSKVEPEIVYVGAEILEGPGVQASDVITAAAGWSVGLEIVHPRFPSFDFTWLDNTADNSSAQAVSVGPTTRLDFDPALVGITFEGDDERRHGTGEQAMGSPAEAVAWLVRSLALENQPLDAGAVVFTGGLTAPFDMQSGALYRAESPALGSVELRT